MDRHGSLQRRELLSGGMAMAFALCTSRSAWAETPDLINIAREAWIYALPLIEFGRARQRARTGAPINTLAHAPALADHTSRTVTTPNADTLYSSARLELASGPVTIVVPASRDRYLSVALIDAYTQNIAILGTRTTPDGGTFRIVGPDQQAQTGTIRAPTNHVWALARTFVSGPADLEAARNFARRISVTGPSVAPPPQIADRNARWSDYFRSADLLMQLNPPPKQDAPFLDRIRVLRLGHGFDPDRFSAAQAREIEQGVAAAREQVRTELAREVFVSGWSYPKPNRGVLGQDYLQRAAIALGGLATLPREEAMYMRAEGDGGGLFRPGKRWRLHLAANHPIPARAFWSLTVYEATPQGQFFLADNPIRRYAISNRTANLYTSDDGSLDVWIRHDDPGPDKRSNWLPAPQAPHALVMRAYLPEPALLSGQYRLPPLVPA